MQGKRYLGIDVSTSRQACDGHTVAAYLEDTGDRLILHSLQPLSTDDELLALLGWSEPHWIGVDAPLSLPPCLACRETSCPCPPSRLFRILGEKEGASYHYRLCDVLIRKTLPGLQPKPPLSTGGPVDITPLTLRWLRLSRTCQREGFDLSKVVEVYASGAAQIYAHFFGLAPRKPWNLRKTPQGRGSLLSALLSELPLFLPHEDFFTALCRYPDAFDAFLAALTSWHLDQGRIFFPASLLGLLPSKPPFLRQLPSLSRSSASELQAYLSLQPWMILPDPWASTPLRP